MNTKHICEHCQIPMSYNALTVAKLRSLWPASFESPFVFSCLVFDTALEETKHSRKKAAQAHSCCIFAGNTEGVNTGGFPIPGLPSTAALLITYHL